MNLVIETDIGHDPDDFFAISYLIAAGVNVRAILVVPGDPDQIAIARLLCQETGLDIPIGASKLDRSKRSSGSIHHDLLKRYNYPLDAKADAPGVDILESVVEDDTELFVIGPVSSIGKYLTKHPDAHFKRATMQGGFLPYHLHAPVKPNYDFFGKTWLPTFNLNGDRPAGLKFLSANVDERRMVGKNVCHGFIFTPQIFEQSEVQKCVKNARALHLFEVAADLYFQRHQEKKFHDPTAACCHLHPEIGTWFRGLTVKMEGGWSTEPDPNGDYILADIDHDKLWSHILDCR